MASHADNKCKTCGKAATLQCSRCAEGVEYDGSPSANVYYCSGVCQKSDFTTHKNGCKQTQQRKILYRAAEQLQASFYVVQRVAFTVNITDVSIVPGTGKLRVVEDPQSSPRAGLSDQRFADDRSKHSMLATVSTDTDHMEANMKALRYMKHRGRVHGNRVHPAASLAYRRDHSRIVEIIRAAKGSRLPNLTPKIQHIVLRLQMGKEAYAFDVAGAELGIAQPLMPWKTYDDKVFGNVFVTMKSSVMMGVWTKSAEDRGVSKIARSNMEQSGSTERDTGLSYARLTQAQTPEEVQDEVVAKHGSTYGEVLGGKREDFDGFLADMLQAFKAKLLGAKASPAGQSFR
ncbi:hypothetical protein LTR95_013170 [Oleoguttula sp. CCFEE 5521]